MVTHPTDTGIHSGHLVQGAPDRLPSLPHLCLVYSQDQVHQGCSLPQRILRGGSKSTPCRPIAGHLHGRLHQGGTQDEEAGLVVASAERKDFQNWNLAFVILDLQGLLSGSTWSSGIAVSFRYRVSPQAWPQSAPLFPMQGKPRVGTSQARQSTLRPVTCSLMPEQVLGSHHRKEHLGALVSLGGV